MFIFYISDRDLKKKATFRIKNVATIFIIHFLSTHAFFKKKKSEFSINKLDAN